MHQTLNLDDPYSSIPAMSTDLNKFLFALYSIRRSAWGLALVINNTDISFSEGYHLERSNLCTVYTDKNKTVYEVIFERRMPGNNKVVTTRELNTYAKTGFDQWCRSFVKPTAHVIWEAMDLAGKMTNVKTVAGKVAGSPGCVLTKPMEQPVPASDLNCSFQYMPGWKKVENNVWVPDNGR